VKAAARRGGKATADGGAARAAVAFPRRLANLLARGLLAWWDRNREALPWRESRTPYSVWVSEVMLQQTVVKAVVPHFERWMRAYPDVGSLAAASEQQVTRAWEGLGYYGRARNLLRAARLVARRWGGELPADYAGLRLLPGVGDYTARAILSIARGQRLAVVDANVRRVLQRLLAAPAPPADVEAQRALERVQPARRAGDFNEALMELGQKVCIKGEPRCGACPLAAGCRARELGREREIPARAAPGAAARDSAALILLRAKAVRLCAHSEGLFRGLWTFPRIALAEAEAAATAAGARIRLVGELRPRTHAYTRYRERLFPRVYAVSAEARGGRSGGRRAEDALARLAGCTGEWVPLAALEAKPMPSAHRRIADEVLAHFSGIARSSGLARFSGIARSSGLARNRGIARSSGLGGSSGLARAGRQSAGSHRSGRAKRAT
jgi:A/G-specific adenine glycosylase